MKVIHTYATGETGGPISKINFYNTILSAHYAKKNYGNIHLVGDNSLIKRIQDMGFEYLYDSITKKQYHKSTLHAWSVPKLKTFSETKEPFLHIDTDSVFFKPINFSRLNRHTANLFSHRDQPQRDISDDYHGDVLGRFIRSELGYDAQLRTYLFYFFTHWNAFGEEFREAFDMNSIPNMNIVYTEDYELINEAADLALGFFYRHKNLEKDRMSACFLEQFLVHTYMRKLDSDYKKASSAGNHVIFEEEPFATFEMPDSPKEPFTNYPSAFSFESVCGSCETNHAEYINIESEKEIDKLYNSDMGGYFHTTVHRQTPMIESYLLHQLERIIGVERIQEIHNYYVPWIERMKQPTISPGELLFEQHTDRKLFSK